MSDQADHGQPPCLADRAQPAGPRLSAEGSQKWGSDIFTIRTRETLLHLAVVIDLLARRIAGWAVANRPHRELAPTALRRAITKCRPAAGLIRHADRSG